MSGVPSLPLEVAFDLAVYVDSVTVKAYEGETLVFDEEYASSMTHEVVIQGEAGIDRVEITTTSGEAWIDNICISG